MAVQARSRGRDQPGVGRLRARDLSSEVDWGDEISVRNSSRKRMLAGSFFDSSWHDGLAELGNGEV